MDIVVIKLMHFSSYLASYCSPWLSEIAAAIIACLLIVIGGDINRMLRRQLSNQNFLVRTFIFVLVNAFGYGLLTITLTPLLANILIKLDDHWLILFLLSIFLFVGSWAQRNHYV